MKLIYVYVRNYKNIREQGFPFSSDFEVSFERNILSIRKTNMEEVKNILYGGNMIKDLHIVVGRTGAGKSNLFQLIGMKERMRMQPENAGSYFLLYQITDGTNMFAIEVHNMFVPQITKTLRLQTRGGNEQLKYGFWQFRYEPTRGELKEVGIVSEGHRNGTAIANCFDRNAFAHCSYDDIVEDRREAWLPRKVTAYTDAFPGMVVRAASEYVEQMPAKSVKRKAAFIINRENWQYKLNIELPRDLMSREYWLYGRRRQSGEVVSLSDIPYARLDGSLPKGRSGTKASAKEMFIHDLLTDYATYLRKIAVSVQEVSKLLSKYRPKHKMDGEDDVEDPTILPDGREDISLAKRLSWLGQYIDYHTDEQNGNKGLVWQECKEIREMAEILEKFEEKYFTPDQFVCPLTDIDEEGDQRFYDLFESMGQYHRDQYGVFQKEYLPYTLTYLSAGELQMARIWGSIQEAIDTKLSVGNTPDERRKIKDLHMIVLMDEPETYLHPEYCREFVYKTVQVLERRNPQLHLQLIITTHSPFMLSDTIASQVTCVDFDDDGECVVLEPTGKPYFAANIFSIMADGFFLDYTIGEYARQFLTGKMILLKHLLDKYPESTDDEREQVIQLRKVLPHIGDEMIRMVFEKMLRMLKYD